MNKPKLLAAFYSLYYGYLISNNPVYSPQTNSLLEFQPVNKWFPLQRSNPVLKLLQELYPCCSFFLSAFFFFFFTCELISYLRKWEPISRDYPLHRNLWTSYLRQLNLIKTSVSWHLGWSKTEASLIPCFETQHEWEKGYMVWCIICIAIL